MYRGVLMAMIAALLCLAADVQPLLAVGRKVKSGAMDICRIIDGGAVVIVDGTEICCAKERRGDDEEGQGTGPHYCVQCDPPGSDNCEMWFGGRRLDPALTIMLGSIRAGQEGILVEQERIRVGLAQVLAGLDNLQTRIDDVQAACAPPDLVPVPLPGSNPPDFCRGDEQGNLVVRVKNQGSTEAPASTLRVTFSTPSGPVSADVPTPALAGAGGLVDLATPLPADCLPRASACSFQIAVDVEDVVVETDEANNSASGACGLLE